MHSQPPQAPTAAMVAAGAPSAPTAALAASSSLFCSGSLLHAVQTAGVFGDSKTFVDCPALADPPTILAAFTAQFGGDEAEQQRQQQHTATREALAAFVSQHFAEAGSDLLPHTPPDLPPSPPFLATCRGPPAVAQWAQALHDLWPSLIRVTSPSVATNPQRHSLLPRSHPVVVPGGRFREAYGWDTFWIVRGLVASGMVATARGAVANLCEDVLRFGHVINGGRVYYTQRSQPPLLSDMVRAVAEALGGAAARGGEERKDAAAPAMDWDYVREALPALEREYAWWMEHRAVTISSGGAAAVLNRYWADSACARPRPESYREDVATAGGDADVMAELTSAAESGWDFSSRWWLRSSSDGGDSSSGSLRDTRTRRILAVDLNTLLHRYAHNLGDMCEALGRTADAQRYHAAAAARADAMNALMWQQQQSAGGASASSSGSGMWRDLVLPEHCAATASCTVAASDVTPSPHVTPACFTPLWGGAAFHSGGRGAAATAALRSSGLLGAGGVLTSLVASGQQWDAPVSWPPLQWMVVEGLRCVDGDSDGGGGSSARQLGDDLARAWLEAARSAWEATGYMHEKLSGEVAGGVGSGGEYEPQVGFGWTNGVALDWIKRYHCGSGGGGSAAHDEL